MTFLQEECQVTVANFGSVRLRFVHGTVQAMPVFGSHSFLKGEGFLHLRTKRFWGLCSIPVLEIKVLTILVWFLGHPYSKKWFANGAQLSMFARLSECFA